ncbi:peptidoglycan DD-metalloendopeptidase family protein [Pseudomonas sp. N040]|uniref:peptidoglycan DD-metalloendopeptidase family protein n=1 Tax=Pseudomonas sp. N040 TaxID=2785325 RepID=UPI0018A26E06|nr:peptidoglycan DD-metalloendopeptidase family protein [Pseudomonas sp. N040]MBF7729728.1 peptidoglycan DD-metalloendopeptidase family protein [Pseudomonas sp. N040]MBW7013370.1 peptidoglycan DD-metalloendopeptidase family protein [Pseudomonas sp. N040]
MRGLALAFLCSSLLAGCSSSSSESVQIVDRNSASAHSQKPRTMGGQYIVQRGDTLYSIAFRFGWDWKALAARNNIVEPYLIRPGQVVRFDALSSAASQPPLVAYKAPAQAVPPAASTPQVYRPPVTPAVVTSSPPVTASQSVETPKSAPAVSPILTPVKLSGAGWAWPAQGALIGRFASNGSLNKGIDIAGELGQPVLAAQDGTVVYAGSGLRGYGELVIIKHSDIYVSAYGHNRSLLVREGQKVKAGQVIADMGSTGADRVKLHFEIRRQGKPVDPLQYLPSR